MSIGRDDAQPRPDRRVGRTRKALKEALTDLILERGYEGVTVQDVIDRADVGRSTFYAHFVDKDDLLMAILADLEMPGLGHEHLEAGRPRLRLDPGAVPPFRLRQAAVQGGREQPERRAGTPRDDPAARDLAHAELSRLAARKLDAFQLETVVRFLVGTFIGFMDWWMREENEHLPAEQVDHAFRSLVLPGVANVLKLELELPESL